MYFSAHFPLISTEQVPVQHDGPAGRYAAAAPAAAALAIRRSRRESLTGDLVVVIVGGHMHFCGR